MSSALCCNGNYCLLFIKSPSRIYQKSLVSLVISSIYGLLSLSSYHMSTRAFRKNRKSVIAQHAIISHALVTDCGLVKIYRAGPNSMAQTQIRSCSSPSRYRRGIRRRVKLWVNADQSQCGASSSGSSIRRLRVLYMYYSVQRTLSCM